MIEDAWMGEGRSQATSADIRRALALLVLACLCTGALLVLVLIALS